LEENKCKNKKQKQIPYGDDNQKSKGKDNGNPSFRKDAKGWATRFSASLFNFAAVL
jgi:hypothetical protein